VGGKLRLQIIGSEGEIVNVGPGLAEEIKEKIKGKELKVGDVLELETAIGKVKVKVVEIRGSPREEAAVVGEETEIALELKPRTVAELIGWFQKEIVMLEEASLDDAREAIRKTQSWTRITARKEGRTVHFFAPTYRVVGGAVVFAPTVVVDEYGKAFKVIPKSKTYTLAIPLSNVEIVEDPEGSNIKALIVLIGLLGGLYVLSKITPKELEALWYEYIRRRKPPYLY